MLAAILSLFGGLAGISNKIADAYVAKQNAGNDRERIAADERIKTLEAKRDVLIAESRTPWNQIMRTLYALPPAIYMAKLYLWDKALGWGSTDPLSPLMEQVLWTSIGFYFVTETVDRLKR